MPFQCEYCKRLFKHKRSRDRHTKLHTGDRRYKCLHCEAAFSRSDHLKIHMKTHDNQKPFQCTVCNRGYNTAAALTSHMQNHKKQIALTGSPTLTYSSRYSPRSTGSASSVVTSVTPKRRPESAGATPNKSPLDFMNFPKSSNGFSCLYCTKSDFLTLDQLHSHIQSMHGGPLKTNLSSPVSVGSPPAYQIQCEFCTIKCANVQGLFNHMRSTHMDKIQSPNTYLEQFKSLYNPYNSRLRVQNGQNDAPHIKEESKSSPDQSIKIEQQDEEEEQTSPTDLSQPKLKKAKITPSSPKIHSPNNNETMRPGTFLCNQCTAALPDFESFRSHLKLHLDNTSSAFLCQTCGNSFADQIEYERHVISHYLVQTTEFSCTPQCNQTYHKPDDLHKHLIEMHAQTLFKCNLCSEIFETKVSIQVHFAVAHSNETKIYRCSTCSESFKVERDFRHHIRTRHINPGAVQCVFCRVVCSSELEMHFHLAAHAKQYKCPACPESFHVEFLLDRHMQSHHAVSDPKLPINNNTIDYHASYPNSLSKNPFYNFGSKFYNPLQVDTLGLKHPSQLFQGLYDSMAKSQRFLETQKSYLSPNKAGFNANARNTNATTFSPENGTRAELYSPNSKNPPIYSPANINRFMATTPEIKNPLTARTETKMYSCGICERSDFSTEAEVHTHRKISHNLKTGVSLRCAYCNGDFRSRTELENHMKVAHNTSGKHKCLICDEIFPSPAVLAEHKLTHCKVGNSGRCSHCSSVIDDITAFKTHLTEHSGQEIPIQCICCRQTLHSEFEISLHARFHTKTTTENSEHTCALCLDPIPATSDKKICESCLKKHNFSATKILPPMHPYRPIRRASDTSGSSTKQDIECNLCKKVFTSAAKLQEHLVEHTFAGCEDRGFICYICSSVFTGSNGLILHMQQEHGNNAKPYDCSRCPAKFFFRAELEHHDFIHEPLSKETSEKPSIHEPEISMREGSDTPKIKKEVDGDTENEDEEYIEVEEPKSDSFKHENVSSRSSEDLQTSNIDESIQSIKS
uniref:CSON005564 protein n=1 Tax=Culicoides sonorensis TaxID=179676 RepID=A0A336LY32_CULSO